MRWRSVVLGILVGAPALAGCVTDERQWMKLNERYSTEDFTRDRKVCTKDGKIDDVCMRNRGWVAVNPGTKAETPRDPLARDLGPSGGRR